MPTPQKAQIIAETSARFQEAKGVYFTKYTGMNVLQATSLRKQFRENDIEYVVTKNTLTKIAAKEAGFEGKFDNILDDYDKYLDFCSGYQGNLSATGISVSEAEAV